MKKLGVSILVAMLLHGGTVHADTVIEEVSDTLPGKGFGGLSGFMAGAAAGGPVGAVLGAGIGWLGGGVAQDASGVAGKAYRVQRDGGNETVVRSPKRSFSPGERVQIVANRLVPANAGEPVRAVTVSHR